MNTLLRSVITHAPKYLTGAAISGLVTLLMTKYYTYTFSPSEYGILALYVLMVQYITTIGSLNMAGGSSRPYFDYRKTQRDEYVSTIFWALVMISGLLIVVSLLLMPVMVPLIAQDTEGLYIITLFVGIASIFVSFLMRILYNEQLSTTVMRHSLLQSFFNHLISFLLIQYAHLGIIGRQIGQGSGYGINILSLFMEFFRKKLFSLKRTFHKKMLMETLHLSLPGMISALQTLLFVYVDRIFLKYYYDDSKVGIYSLGFLLGKGLSMIYEAISMALFPKVITGMQDNYEKGRDELERFAIQYYVMLLVVTTILSLNSEHLIRIFSNQNYLDAAGVLPFILVGFMMGGFYKIPQLLLGYHKKVWIYPFLTVISFGINAYLNYILIKRYEMIGAAYASFIGLFLYSLLLQIYSSKFSSRTYNLFNSIIYILVFLLIGYLFNQNIN